MKNILFAILSLTLVSLLMLACGADEVVPEIDEGKADIIGNIEEGYSCNFDYQCKSDHGMICRPTYDIQGLIRDTCQLPANYGAMCLEDGDCEDYLECKENYGSEIGFCDYRHHTDAGPG